MRQEWGRISDTTWQKQQEWRVFLTLCPQISFYKSGFVCMKSLRWRENDTYMFITPELKYLWSQWIPQNTGATSKNVFIFLFFILTLYLRSSLIYCLFLSQVWNALSANCLCQILSWSPVVLEQGRWRKWPWSLAATSRRTQNQGAGPQGAGHQGASCVLHSTDPKGKRSGGPTPCVRSATSNSTHPRRPRSTTTANPTRRGWKRSATAKCQTAQVGQRWFMVGASLSRNAERSVH